MDRWEKNEYGYPIGECNSLSNIYYGKFIKHFPFKQINRFLTKRAYKKKEKYDDAMDKKYGDCFVETDDLKFIWGVTSFDEWTSHEANFYTMNDIDIIYDKQKKEYILGVETAYIFETYQAECNYLQKCLDAFTQYMDDNELDKNKHYRLFMSEPCTNVRADSIEELYTNFKIFVNGFCNQNIDMGEKKYEDRID